MAAGCVIAGLAVYLLHGGLREQKNLLITDNKELREAVDGQAAQNDRLREMLVDAQLRIMLYQGGAGEVLAKNEPGLGTLPGRAVLKEDGVARLDRLSHAKGKTPSAGLIAER